jgi:nucleotide-binding universal stress UspA family protein
VSDPSPENASDVGQPKLSTARYRVLAALDFSSLGDRAVLESLRLCSTQQDAELHVLSVGEAHGSSIRLPGPEPRLLPLVEAEEATRGRVQRLVDEYLSSGGSVYIEKISIHLIVGSPAERIVWLAGALDADVVVLGTHGRQGLQRMLLGSVAEAVMRHAPCGVFVIRPRDFLHGEKVPDLSPPLEPGDHPLKPFLHNHHYHYVDRVSRFGERILPVA